MQQNFRLKRSQENQQFALVAIDKVEITFGLIVCTINHAGLKNKDLEYFKL